VGWAWLLLLLLLLLVHSAGGWGPMLPRIPSGAHANEASCGGVSKRFDIISE
jgi:hypothetical protein